MPVPATADAPPPVVLSPNAVEVSDVNETSDLAVRLGIDTELPPMEDPAPPADGGAAGGSAGETPPGQSNNAEFAAKRVAEREKKDLLTRELEEARTRLTELEGMASRLPELEQKEVEYRTLAEQRAAELKAYTERYQNETSVLDESLLPEIPEVAAAQEHYNKVATSFFPKDLSNPNDDEPEIRLNPQHLPDTAMRTIRDQLDYWRKQETESKLSASDRSTAQHIAISNIAAAMGTDTSKFHTVTFQGEDFLVLPRRHPVYAHLAAHVPQVVEARSKAEQAAQTARESKYQALETVKTNRMSNTRNMMTQVGVGLTGEALTAALAKSPENPILKTMKLLENDPQLLDELRREVDMEVLVNGHLRPHLDLVDPDPKAYTEKARSMYTRIGQRAVHAPLAPVLMKKVLSQSSRISELETELAAVKAERDKSVIQQEPGSVGASGNPPVPVANPNEPYLADIASRLGL